MTTPPSFQDILDECRTIDGSLSERLTAFAETLRKHYPSFAEAVDRLVTRLQKTGAGRHAPDVGDTVPPFLLPDETGHLVSLEDLLRKGPLALTFNRGHWCPYCRINVEALSQAQRDIAHAGGQVAAVIPDRQPFASELKQDLHADFPVLIDLDNGYAMSLGLAFWVGDEMKREMIGADYDIEKYQGNQSWLLPIPATFVIARTGKVTARFIDPDYRKRMTVEEMLAALRRSD